MTCCISQLFVLSPRGDKIIFKDYRNDVVRTTDEVFMRVHRFYDSKAVVGAPGPDAPPFFNVDGVNYCAVKRNGLLFVAATRFNVSPNVIAEFLIRLTNLLKDFCAVSSEDSLRKNFTLVYEILDEAIDHGYIQETSTERLRPYIFNEAATVEDPGEPQMGAIMRAVNKIPIGGTTKTRSHNAANVSITASRGKNEVYVDVIEKISATFSGGMVQNAVIEGSILMKSLLAGSPLVRLKLNEDMAVGRDNRRGYSAGVHLDDCNFHTCVNSDHFEQESTLLFNPPDGEFTVMNYRVTGTDFLMPFRVDTFVDTVTPYKVEVTLRVRSDLPSSAQATGVIIKFGAPKTTTSVAVELGVGAEGQSHNYNSTEKKVTWTLKKFNGSTEHMIKVRMSLESPANSNVKKEIGPVSMGFEVPNHNMTGLQIRLLQIEERSKSYNPTRWVRNITQANSYTFRVA